MPPAYALELSQRAAARGVTNSEALRQIMDEARQRSVQQFRNTLMGKLNAIKISAAGLRLVTQKNNIESLGQLKNIDDCVTEIAGIIAGVTCV